MHIWQAFNALFIIRSLVKYLIETGSEYQLLQHFEAVPNLEEISQQQQNDKPSTLKQNQKTNEIVAIDVEGKKILATTTMPTTSVANNNEKLTSNIVDGSKFEAFFEAVVNIIVIIPVK